MSAMLRLSDTRARYVQSAAFGFESYFTVYYMKGWVDYVYRMFSCYNCLFSFFVTHHVFFACGGALLCTKREEKKGVCVRGGGVAAYTATEKQQLFLAGLHLGTNLKPPCSLSKQPVVVCPHPLCPLFAARTELIYSSGGDWCWPMCPQWHSLLLQFC